MTGQCVTRGVVHLSDHTRGEDGGHEKVYAWIRGVSQPLDE